jgi:DNA-binding transcriptional MerR regulator
VRIKELAELTDVTVRTIRYYHQIGLLPIPRTHDGVRDYDMVHVARVVRIRWLAEAGVELSRIGGMLHAPVPSAPDSDDEARMSVLADLRATVVTLDEQLSRLRTQRNRVDGLMTAIEQGGRLSPMPAAIGQFYDSMEARAADRSVRRTIRRERDFVELAFYRGDMPPEAAVLYEGLTEAARAGSLELFGQLATRSEPGQSYSEEEVAHFAAAAVDRITAFLGADLHRVFSSIDLTVARRAADLYVRLSDDHERGVDRVIADALLSAIEKEHPS